MDVSTTLIQPVSTSNHHKPPQYQACDFGTFSLSEYLPTT